MIDLCPSSGHLHRAHFRPQSPILGSQRYAILSALGTCKFHMIPISNREFLDPRASHRIAASSAGNLDPSNVSS